MENINFYRLRHQKKRRLWERTTVEIPQHCLKWQEDCASFTTEDWSSVTKCGCDFYDHYLKPAIGRDNRSSLLKITLKQAEPTGPLRVGVYVFSHTLSSLFPFETFSSIQVSHFGRSSTDSLFKRYIEKKHPLKLNFPLFYSLHAKEFRGEECPLGIGFLKPNINQDVLFFEKGR